jgi:peptidoglycan hydrolase-like protein with peptidoglycan-binding domain
MPSLNVLINGRKLSGGGYLNGPLGHLGLGRDGTYYMVGAGTANHAGPGKWQGYSNGGSGFIGIEAENMGYPEKDPWPDVQIDAYIRGVAALLAHVGLPADRCCSHREWARPSGRKSDPHTIDMDDFRANVAGAIAGTYPGRPIIQPLDANNNPTLRRGSRGAAVKQLQSKLGVGADGIFGPLTEATVRQFQREHGLVGDGIVGPLTWAKLLD